MLSLRLFQRLYREGQFFSGTYYLDQGGYVLRSLVYLSQRKKWKSCGRFLINIFFGMMGSVTSSKRLDFGCPDPDHYGRTLSDASMLYFADVFLQVFFFMAALVGQTAERIFTKLSHVVDIRCYLRTY